MEIFERGELQDDMGSFEAALHAKKVSIPKHAPKAVLAVLDGTDQSDAARALAGHIAKHVGAKLDEATDLQDGHDILKAAKERLAGLIVAPAPFRENYNADKDESLGSGIDILLAESKVPVLLVRDPKSATEACLADILVSISVYDARAAEAVGWALALVADRGRIELLDIPDITVIEEAKKLLGDTLDAAALQKEAIARVAHKNVGGLVAALQKEGAAKKLQVSFDVKVGHPVKLVAEAGNERPRLVIVEGDPDPGAQSHYRAHALALLSTSPVLIV